MWQATKINNNTEINCSSSCIVCWFGADLPMCQCVLWARACAHENIYKIANEERRCDPWKWICFGEMREGRSGDGGDNDEKLHRGWNTMVLWSFFVGSLAQKGTLFVSFIFVCLSCCIFPKWKHKRKEEKRTLFFSAVYLHILIVQKSEEIKNKFATNDLSFVAICHKC